MATSDFNTQMPLEAQVPTRLLTVADLAALPDELPSGPVDYELDHGRLIMMSPPSDRHGGIQARICAELIFQGDKCGHGKSRTEAGVVLSKDPDRVVGPDVLFIAKASLPLKLSPEGYLETIPDLVVEIRSKNDSIPYLERKVAEYLQVGVQQVWVVDPDSRTLVIHKADAKARSFQQTDAITSQDFPLIPDFRLVLAEVFAD